MTLIQAVVIMEAYLRMAVPRVRLSREQAEALGVLLRDARATIAADQNRME